MLIQLFLAHLILYTSILSDWLENEKIYESIIISTY